MLHRLVSGGQTGVDRAALDAGLEAGIPIGGWCPQGRRAEDGIIPDRYSLTETPSPEYDQRTEWNVRDSDGTLVLRCGARSGGTDLTIDVAKRFGKPLLVLERSSGGDLQRAAAWVSSNQIRVLNVAGPRASEAPEGYDAARIFLRALFRRLQST